MAFELTIRLSATPEDLSSAREIRRLVFIDEQGIPARLEYDGHDDIAFHALGIVGNLAVATGRLVIHDLKTADLGRVAVLPDYRGAGIGRHIVAELASIASQEDVRTITIHPHEHLELFYRRLGYETVQGTSTVGHHRLITMRRTIRSEDTPSQS